MRSIFALIAVAVVAAGVWLKKPDGIAVSDEMQVVTALHEASHVIAAHVLRPHDPPNFFYVSTAINGAADAAPAYGRAQVGVELSEERRAEALRFAAIILAGNAAEGLTDAVQGNAPSLPDMKKANVAVRLFHYGGRGPWSEKSVFDAENVTETAADRATLQTYYLDAQGCAAAIVEENGDAIRALALHILKQAPRFGRRSMGSDQLRSYFHDHEVTRPMTACNL